jgi:hypothetical protein
MAIHVTRVVENAMASIQLSRHEAAGDLPEVCAVCGAAADGKSTGRVDAWPWATSLTLPFCRPHGDHLLLRRLFLTGIYCSFLLVAVIPLLLVWDIKPTPQAGGAGSLRAWLAARVFPIAAGAMCLTFGALYYFLCIKVARLGSKTVTLNNVAAEFVRALQRQRRHSAGAANDTVATAEVGAMKLEGESTHVRVPAGAQAAGSGLLDKLADISAGQVARPEEIVLESVLVPLEAAAAATLPTVCMVCGQAAPERAYIHLPSTRLFSVIPFYAPLCESHKHHFRFAQRAVVGALLLCFLGACLFVMGIGITLFSRNPLLHWCGFAALICGLIVFFSRDRMLRLVHSQGIHVVAMDRYKVELKGVATAFAQAVAAMPPDLQIALFGSTPPMAERKLPGTFSASFPLAQDSVSALESANTFARQCRQDYLGSEHLLFGLCQTIPSVAAFVLKSQGVEPAQVRATLQKDAAVDDVANLPARLPFTPVVKRILDNAVGVMNRMVERVAPGATSRVVCRVGTEHILIALLDESDSEAVQTLLALDVDLDELRQSLRKPLATVVEPESAIRPART